jgi:hypothetical protein
VHGEQPCAIEGVIGFAHTLPFIGTVLRALNERLR